MTPEMLWFRSYSHEAPQRYVMLGEADVVFAFAGVIYAMGCEEWLHFERMTKAALAS